MEWTWNEKLRIKLIQINIDIFSNQTLLELQRLFVSVYSNQDNIAERFKTRWWYLLTNGIINNYNVTINGKSFYD